MVISFFESLGVWSWFVAGVALLALEILVPGTFVLWLGLAAIATGLVTLAIDPGWQVQLVLFAAFSVVSVLIWLAAVRRRARDNDHPMLGRRAESHVGKEFVLDAPVAGGSGRVRIDDTVWRISGADCPAGTRVRVVRADGAVLVVEPAD